ncbi:MAG TPA: hypothetical protein DD727_03780 [Clostridiales bacterium]|nr:hypothetical protein [Clostridiales bacterium]
MDSFEEDITLPDYTVKLLDLFVSLTSDEAREYNSYVYATYSALKTADAERNDYLYNALVTAYNNTTRLIDELKTLHNNIRRHHQALNDFATANDVLKGHFDIYKTLIMDRIYHPLKTLDSVPRFKAPILRILADWLSDLPLRQMMSDQAIQRGKFSAPEEAMEDILRKISNIMDLYEGMDAMLEQIDRKNTAYTRSSIEKMRYLLNTDRSIKGKLVDLLTDIARNPVHAAKILGFDSCINLYRQGFVDEKSLYTRTDRSALREGVPLKIAEFGETFGDSQVQGFIHRARLIYTSQNALKYIEELMAGRVVLSSPEIKLSNDHDFILLMLATLRSGDRNLFYRVEFLEGTLESGGYRIPNMRFVRKEVKAHVG